MASPISCTMDSRRCWITETVMRSRVMMRLRAPARDGEPWRDCTSAKPPRYTARASAPARAVSLLRAISMETRAWVGADLRHAQLRRVPCLVGGVGLRQDHLERTRP